MTDKKSRLKWKQLAQIVESEKPNTKVGLAMKNLLLISLELNKRLEKLEDAK